MDANALLLRAPLDALDESVKDFLREALTEEGSMSCCLLAARHFADKIWLPLLLLLLPIPLLRLRGVRRNAPAVSAAAAVAAAVAAAATAAVVAAAAAAAAAATAAASRLEHLDNEMPTAAEARHMIMCKALGT